MVVVDYNNAGALVDQLFDARHALAGSSDHPPTTTRVVVRSEQAAYHAQWRAACSTTTACIDGDRNNDDALDDADDHDHPYVASGTAALTTPAGSWLVHRDDVATRARLCPW